MNEKRISEESKKKLENEYINSLAEADVHNPNAEDVDVDAAGMEDENAGSIGEDAGINAVASDSRDVRAEDAAFDFITRLIERELEKLQPLPDGFKEELKETWKVRECRVKKSSARERRVDESGAKEGGKHMNRKKKLGIKAVYVLAASLLIVLLSYPLMNMFGVKSPKSDRAAYETDHMNGFKADLTGGEVSGYDTGNQRMNITETDFDIATAAEKSAGEQRGTVGAANPGSGEQGALKNKKIIENFTVGIHTEEFDRSRQKLEDTAAASGGFISSFEVYTNEHREKGIKTQHASITVKIPSENSGSYMDTLHQIGEVYNESKTMEDVTKAYADIEIEIRNFEEAEKRYLALYQKAESIEDMLLVENELSRLRNMIDTRKASLMNYDYKVMYATFYISLNEVIEIKPVVSVEPGMWERAKDGFVEGLNAVISGAQNIFVYLVSIIPALLVTMVTLVIVLLIVTLIRKKFKKRAAHLGNEKTADSTVKTDILPSDVSSSSDKKAE